MIFSSLLITFFRIDIFFKIFCSVQLSILDLYLYTSQEQNGVPLPNESKNSIVTLLSLFTLSTDP